MWLKQRFSHHWPGRGLAQHGPHLYRQPRLRRTEPLANGRLSEIPFRNVQASFTPDSNLVGDNLEPQRLQVQSNARSGLALVVIIAQANCQAGRQSYSVHMRKQAFDDDNPVSKNGTDASRVQPTYT
jgi:hypothetical protein